LILVPISLKQAKEFVSKHHRHNQPPVGWKWGVGLQTGETLVGVAMAGRPVARLLDDGLTLEITRVCTLGDKNANSMLYGAALRAGRALGYRRFVTYTLESESGASLRAVGFKDDGKAGGGEWNRPNRKRKASQEVGYSPEPKVRWTIQ